MRLFAFMAVAIVLCGCGLLPSPQPDWVVNRQPLTSCGVEDPNELNAEARRCLLAAYQAGTGAELISTQTSVEGDPITRFIRVHDNGTIEIFHDATQDRFGSGSWERLRCERLIPVDAANDPPDTVFPAEIVFIEDGCESLPVP